MLSTFLTNTGSVIIVLGVMIFIHEMGHFLAAKFFRIRVLTFSLGFGPRLVGFRKGDTDYRIAILPLGGYVKMAGEQPTDDRTGDPAEFYSKPRWQRFIVVAMGPLMNGLLALVLMGGLFHFHYEKPAFLGHPARVGDVEKGSLAQKAGIMPGDRILKVKEISNPTWEELQFEVLTTVNEPVSLTILRDRKRFDLEVTPEPVGPNKVGSVGWLPYMPAVLDVVDPGLPAGLAGLKKGDQITSFNSKSLFCWLSLSPRLQSLEGSGITLTVLREKEQFDVNLKPIFSKLGEVSKWRIGVIFSNEVVVEQLPWLQAFKRSAQELQRNISRTFYVVGKLITGNLSARSLSGPIGIAQISGQAYQAGLPQLIEIMAFISLQLGILNLLPIPVLDGGVILFLGIESLMRRDMSLKLKERLTMAGMMLLVMFAVFVMYNDIIKIISPG